MEELAKCSDKQIILSITFIGKKRCAELRSYLAGTFVYKGFVIAPEKEEWCVKYGLNCVVYPEGQQGPDNESQGFTTVQEAKDFIYDKISNPKKKDILKGEGPWSGGFAETH